MSNAILDRKISILNKRRTGASVNAYLILRQKNQILFSLRKNTGYCDGMWGFVAGHVEDGESATSAIIREAQEEINLQLLPFQVEVIHVMHRKTDRLNIDIFFDCPSWQGIIENKEPDKCEKLEFFSIDSLPPNTIEYDHTILERIANKQFYSETGWN